MRYFRVRIDSDDPRLVARDGRTAYDLSSARPALSSFRDLAMVASTTNRGVDDVAEALLDDAPVVGEDDVESGAVRPVVPDEVWATGVTYEASGDAREDESGRPEMYQDVFENDRPELFFKATPSRTVGPDDRIGVREDSEWDVPEPELGVVLYEGDIVGYTVGDDVSSRDLEGQNPLYLPQAKVFERCCAVGPCVASPETVEDPHDLKMSMTISRDGETAFEGETDTSLMARTCEELVSYRNRHDETPELSVLLTGTSIVPPSEFTLREGDRVEIAIENVGTLTNTVTTV
jgi:2-dehydro-3-deoxy-D-arabinonate dehydratase